MTNTDTTRFQAGDLAAAMGLLTRLPVTVDGPRAQARGAAAAWAYPLVGLALGLMAGALAVVAGWCGLPSGVTAGLVLLLMALATGAMHEDGLADCADGFWGGWDRARRLEIMKDSHIGAYGVLALVLAMGLRWAALGSLLGAGVTWAALLVPAMVSRAAMVWAMAHLPHARDTGLSQAVGRPARQVAFAAVGIAAIGAFVMATGAFIWVAVVSAGVVAGGMALARGKIGGQTGDVLGAVQIVVEIAVLCVLVAGLG